MPSAPRTSPPDRISTLPGSLRRAAPLLALLLAAAPGSAQTALLSSDFEWGDTADWSASVPPRCDRLEAFGRWLLPAAELHVATTGDDSTGDGTPGNPFATIGRAADDALPGTAIRVHAGTYAGGTFLSDLAGTETAPIWIGGAPGEARPVLEGGGEGLHLSRGRYLVVHDLEVRNAVSNGINADDGGDSADPLATHHLTFHHVFIHAIGGGGNQDCLKLSGVNDYTVALSEFASCGGGTSGSGVDHVGCHRGLLARNRFHDLSANAIQSKGSSSDLDIRWNQFTDAGARGLNLGGSTGLEFFRPPLSTSAANAEARDLRVVANLFEGSDAAVAYVGCVGCVVAHNTIVDPQNWILRILQETTTSPPYTFEACRDGVFVDNLVSFERAALSTHLNIGPDTAPATFTFASNLWHARDDPAQSQPSLPVAETGGLYGVDPELGPGYRIAPTSPAAGSGQSTIWSWGDFDGFCYADPPSRGAFEAR